MIKYIVAAGYIAWLSALSIVASVYTAITFKILCAAVHEIIFMKLVYNFGALLLF